MWTRKAPYTIKLSAPEIVRHDQLPDGCRQVLSVQDNTENIRWIFFENNGLLSIAEITDRALRDGSPLYICVKNDFPLEFLTWFPDALADFQRPPSEGGLHAGAMTTPDMEVGGEMLCVQRALGVDQDRGGYIVRNRSRCKNDYDPETEFEPHSVCWASRFLYEGGLLDLIKELGQKLKDGKI
jgi:hypothetical protein